MMNAWKTLWAKLAGPGRAFRKDLSDELEAHLQMEIDEKIAAGMTPDAARQAALREFGNVTQAREEAQDVWAFRWLDALKQDIRFAIRTLAKNPAFTAVAVLTLALGIGANAAMFSVINAVLLESLPYLHSDRLVVLDEYKVDHGSRSVGWLDFQDWKKQTSAFDDMAAYRLAHYTLTSSEEPTLVRAAETSASFFPLLGVAPASGRTFAAADDRAGAAPTVVLSYEFWRNRLRGDPAAIGKSLDLDGRAYSIIGILPAGFSYFDKRVDMYVPVGLHANEAMWNRRGFHPDLLVLARLRDGESLSAARAQMNTIMSRLDAQYPKSNAGMLASVATLHDYRFGSIQPLLLTLLAAVGCVLLIAAVNIANLLLARGSARTREMAIRVALGAGAGRLFRQLLTESLLLSITGGATGLLAAWVAIHTLIGLAPSSVPDLSATRIDGRVVLFTLAVSVVVGVIFGTIPALIAAKTDIHEAFQEGGRGGGPGRASKRMRAALLIAETGFALVLIMATALLVRSLINATAADPGFRPDHTLALDVILPTTRYPDIAHQALFYQDAVRQLGAIPRVEAAGAAFCPPLVGICSNNAFTLSDHQAVSAANLPTAAFNVVVPGYFEALKVPVDAGRLFTGFDRQNSRLVAIVNRTFAQRYWPNENAIGKLLKEGGPESNAPYREVVGIVRDVKQDGMDVQPRPEVFFPVDQYPFAPWDDVGAMTFVVRVPGDPMAIAAAAKSAIWSTDKDLPVTAVRPLLDYRTAALARRKSSTVLLALFGALALLLAAVGIYGVMSYNVTQRTREIGTRVALGAGAADIRNLVLGETLRLTAAAILAGTAGVWASMKWMQTLLFGIKASDPLTFCATCIILVLTALLASYVPMRRAARIDPVTALRAD